MTLFTFFHGRSFRASPLIFLGLFFVSINLVTAQTDTNAPVPGPGEMTPISSVTNTPDTNAPSSIPTLAPDITTAPAASPTAPVSAPEAAAVIASSSSFAICIVGALMTLASMGGFLLYQCGLTRAKNSAHTCTLLLVGVLFGLTGYWIGGFAVQMGGVGDSHAALSEQLPALERNALDHELGPVAFGHHWGLMGSSGFFLATDDPARDGIATLFLVQAALLTIAVAAALGAALERGKLLAMAFCAYLVGVLIYPLLANWVWGGGWLAELGREFGLGHGFVDVAGAGVVHETAGTLALVIAVVLGPRHGRFGRVKISNTIPGHNVPFIVLGSIVLLVSWMATNAFAATGLSTNSDPSDPTKGAGLAAINTLLAATGGLVISLVQTAWQKRRPEPARLCRGLLGGAVASCGGAALIDPWAAFVIGGIAALLVQAAMDYLDRKRIDDPVGAAAVHGAGGAWGVLAIGLFANGSAGSGINGIVAPVRGLFFGGAWHQLAAQAIGCVTGFVVIYVLGLACVNLVHKILGIRVDLSAEASGLDMPEVGALGYQGDVEADDDSGKS